MLDGKLSARERARLTEHLAGCESCYEIFAGTAHILDDSREEQLQVAASPRPFERPREARAVRPRVWWAAAALAAVLAATVGLVVFLQGTRGAGPTTEQLASLVGPVDPAQIPWIRRTRGGTNEVPEVRLDREAFRLGVRFLDLRLAVERDNYRGAEEAVSLVNGLLSEMDLPPPKTVETYKAIQRKIQTGVRLTTLLAAAAAAEKQASAELQEDPRLVELGRWTEACRLEGASGRADLFRQRATLRVLDQAIEPGGKDAVNLDPLVVPAVRAIRDQIAAGRITPTDLGQRCEQLLRQLDYD